MAGTTGQNRSDHAQTGDEFSKAVSLTSVAVRPNHQAPDRFIDDMKEGGDVDDE